MKKLPIGIQDFAKLRSNNFLYVDKTKIILELLEGAGYYFLSRPRRFGKSLLVSTLKEFFLGNKEPFEGLFIEDKIDWKEYPVIHLDFAKADYKQIGLEKSIKMRLKHQAEQYEIALETDAISSNLDELIKKLYKKYDKQVVLLIDEYDKPIIDFLGKEEVHIAEKNREMMKNFYSPIKSLDPYLRFFFLTGVSKFSKVSIFSDLNNLLDLTLHRIAKTLLGYTQSELECYFADYISQIATYKSISETKLKKQIREWYNGYSFGGEKLYNPFSIINFMSDGEFNNYWFKTGTPTFLIKLIAEKNIYNVKEIETSLDALEKFDITNLNPIVVLFQTGYFTLKENLIADIYRLGYPNKEVQRSMNQLLLAEYTKKETTETSGLLYHLKLSFDENNLDKVFSLLNSLFADIPYQIFETKRESYYHSVIFLTFKLLGYYSEAEVSTSIGRIDAVVKNDTTVYIIEFKVDDTAKNALWQIQDRRYAEKYLSENKKIVLVGVACNEKTIKEYLIETYSESF